MYAEINRWHCDQGIPDNDSPDKRLSYHPSFRKGDKAAPANYRPISLTIASVVR